MEGAHRGAKGMRPLAVIVAVLLCSAGCAALPLQEPTVTVENVTIENVTLQSVDLLLQVTIENPNPIGATLNRVAFNVSFLDDGQWVFLAHGERGGFSVRPRGTTTVSIPVTVDNLRLVQALLQGLSDGAITLRVSGTGVFDYGIATFEVPFDRTTEVQVA